MRTKTGRSVLFGFAAIVGGLVIASAAFACTTYKGKLTVTPNGTGSSGSVTADGNSLLGMSYCSGPTGTAQLKQGNSVTLSSTGTTSCLLRQSHLNANTSYNVTWLTGPSSVDCMYTGGNVGSFTTNGSGDITSYTTSAFSPSVGMFQLCVSNQPTATGNQVGLTAVA